jgi:hypothetical protein
MDQKKQKVYRFANDQASSELRQILNSFEQLCAKNEKFENLIEAIKPSQTSETELHVKSTSQRKTHLPNCIVVTRLTVL